MKAHLERTPDGGRSCFVGQDRPSGLWAARPILEKGFPDQFVLHHGRDDRTTWSGCPPMWSAHIRGIAVSNQYGAGRCQRRWRGSPSSRSSPASASATTMSTPPMPGEHDIIVTNTPDVLTEEVADIAMGLLIATLREFVKADRYVRSGLWSTQEYPLSAARCATARWAWSAWAGSVRRSRAGSKPPGCRWSITSRKPAAGVAYQHYPDLIEMAKAVDTLVVIVPGGARHRQDDQCRGDAGAGAARRDRQRGTRLGDRRAGADRRR